MRKSPAMSINLSGALLLAITISIPTMAWADQIPPAVVTGDAYRVSPHLPTPEETMGEDQSFLPNKPLDGEIPAYSPLSPHKPSADEMPAAETMIMPRQTSGSSNVKIILPSDATKNAPRQPEPMPALQAPQTQASPAAAPPQRITPHKDAENHQGAHNDWRRLHPKPFRINQNAQLSPMMGLGAACLNSSVTICGKVVRVPAGPIGAVANLVVPFPHQPQPFTVQCLAVNGTPAYRIVDATEVTCDLQTCPPSDVTLCGAPVNIPTSVKVGGSVKVPVPPSVLANPESGYNLVMRARCAEGPNATAKYRVDNAEDISCNLFPCQTSTVRLCNAAIEVPGGAPLGAVLTLTMPSPFAPEQFAVQCLGSMGLPAVYQIIDHEGVSCNLAESQPNTR
ncbi:MAG: hypothetical protein ABTQ34_04980 [Bdellovibrionales bacterium]